MSRRRGGESGPDVLQPDLTTEGAAVVIAGLLTDDPTAADARAAARDWIRAFEEVAAESGRPSGATAGKGDSHVA